MSPVGDSTCQHLHLHIVRIRNLLKVRLVVFFYLMIWIAKSLWVPGSYVPVALGDGDGLVHVVSARPGGVSQQDSRLMYQMRCKAHLTSAKLIKADIDLVEKINLKIKKSIFTQSSIELKDIFN